MHPFGSLANLVLCSLACKAIVCSAQIRGSKLWNGHAGQTCILYIKSEDVITFSNTAVQKLATKTFLLTIILSKCAIIATNTGHIFSQCSERNLTRTRWIGFRPVGSRLKRVFPAAGWAIIDLSVESDRSRVNSNGIAAWKHSGLALMSN